MVRFLCCVSVALLLNDSVEICLGCAYSLAFAIVISPSYSSSSGIVLLPSFYRYSRKFGVAVLSLFFVGLYLSCDFCFRCSRKTKNLAFDVMDDFLFKETV